MADTKPGKLTDEQVRDCLRDLGMNGHRSAVRMIRTHIAALEAERKELDMLATEHGWHGEENEPLTAFFTVALREDSEVLALRERLASLQGSLEASNSEIVTLRERAQALEGESEVAHAILEDEQAAHAEALGRMRTAESRLAAIRQRAGDANAMADAVHDGARGPLNTDEAAEIGAAVVRYIVGEDDHGEVGPNPPEAPESSPPLNPDATGEADTPIPVGALVDTSGEQRAECATCSERTDFETLCCKGPRGVVTPTEPTAAEAGAALCYLSAEGVVRIPKRIREALGLLNGGGVMFLEREGHVEMMSDERFAAMLEVGEDEPTTPEAFATARDSIRLHQHNDVGQKTEGLRALSMLKRHMETMARAMSEVQQDLGQVAREHHMGTGADRQEECEWFACEDERILRAALTGAPPVFTPSVPAGLAHLIDGFAAEVRAAEDHAQRPKGGQQVTPTGDFVRCSPSMLGRLRWWANALREGRTAVPVFTLEEVRKVFKARLHQRPLADAMKELAALRT